MWKIRSFSTRVLPHQIGQTFHTVSTRVSTQVSTRGSRRGSRWGSKMLPFWCRQASMSNQIRKFPSPSLQQSIHLDSCGYMRVKFSYNPPQTKRISMHFDHKIDQLRSMSASPDGTRQHLPTALVGDAEMVQAMCQCTRMFVRNSLMFALLPPGVPNPNRMI